MGYSIIRFPVPGGGGKPASSNGFGFIKPIGRQSRLDPSHDIGVIAHGPYDIVDVGALLASQAELNRTATPLADKHLTVAAFDSPIPVPYGHIKVPALLANAVTWNNNWYFWCLWGRGPIDAVESLYINDLAPAFGFSESKLGDPGQTIIGAMFIPMTTWYRAKTGSTTATFDQTAPGIAHSVIIAPVGDIEQPPTLNAILRGLKIYDPRDPHQSLGDPTTWRYSNNAALCLADFLRSRVYGAGMAVDDNSLITAADAADDHLRTVNLLIDKKAQLSDWVATLQQAANCRLDLGEASVKLVPDAYTAAVATYSHINGDILSVTKEAMDNRKNLPTVVEVVYSDASETTWKDATVNVQRPGVAEGTLPWRKSTVRMPWIVDYGNGVGKSQALRECFLRMNQAWLRLPKLAIGVMDEGVIPAVGDAVGLVYPDSGYVAYFKVDDSQATDSGWGLACFYDDPGAYNDTSIAEPTPPTPNPDPFAIPPVRNLAATEDPIDPKLITTWLPPLNYPYVLDYPFTVDLVGGSPSRVYDSNPPNRPAIARPDPSFTTPDLIPGNDYSITVWVRNVFGMLGPPTTIIAHVNALTYVAFRYTFTTPTLVNMKRLFDWSTGRYYWVTSMGNIWNPTFPNLLNTYTNPIFTYHTPGTSTLTTEVADALRSYTGDWESTLDRSDINGIGAQYIELSTTSPSSRTRHAGVSFTGTGRYVALSSEATGSGTQRVDDLGEISVTVTR